MNAYARSVFPRLMDAALATPAIARLRRELLAAVCGDILELGFGTGLNLACYPAAVRRLTAVDVRHSPLAEPRLAASPIAVRAAHRERRGFAVRAGQLR